MVKNLPAEHETQLQSLGQDDTMEKEMATHSDILAWQTTGRSKQGTDHEVAESDTTEQLNSLVLYKYQVKTGEIPFEILEWEKNFLAPPQNLDSLSYIACEDAFALSISICLIHEK